MTTQFDCALNGVLLSSLNDRICVLDIHEDAPRMRTTALSLHQGGQRLLSHRREKLEIQITFAIHEEDPALRRAALRSVHAWAAKGGMMTLSDRPGQQLRVYCTTLPGISAASWTDPLTLIFASSISPYWEDEQTTSVSASDVMTLTVPGTADAAPVDVLVFNDSDETVTALKLHCGSTEMVFEGISLPAGSLFTLVQSDGQPSARILGESVLACRTAGSDDMLLAPCGSECTVYASAGQPLQASFTARGRYV